MRSEPKRPDGRTRPLRLAGRLLGVVLCAWLLGGCGVKLAYNNIDRFVRWSADDYIDMDPAQQKYFDAELAAVLYWHRTTQLPLYADELRRFDAALADGATVEELTGFSDGVEDAWHRVLEATLPLGSQLLYTATDAQLAQFQAESDKSVEKYVKPFVKLSIDERRKRWAKDFRDDVESFTGRLDDAQKALIEARSAAFVPDDVAWADYRRRYTAALMDLLRERRPFVDFLPAYRDVTFNRERWYGDAYAQALAANREVYRAVSLELLESLTDEQRRTLSRNLLNIAKDFDELAQEAPAAPPPAACLVDC